MYIGHQLSPSEIKTHLQEYLSFFISLASTVHLVIMNSVENQKSKGKYETGAKQTRTVTKLRGRIECHGGLSSSSNLSHPLCALCRNREIRKIRRQFGD